jgi:pseudo-rSAM protein
MKRGGAYWFYIEPYVFATIKRNDHVLLYNTHNGDFLEYKNQPLISRLVKKILAHDNLSVVKLTAASFAKPVVSEFVRQVRDKFLGDLLEVKRFPQKPVQMVPFLNIEKDVAKFKVDAPDRVGEDLMTYLSEISIHLTNECRLGCRDCSTAYLQIPHCTKKIGSPIRHLSLSKIEDVFQEATGTSLFRLNFLGGNVLLYPYLDGLLELLERIKAVKSFYIHYQNIDSRDRKLEALRRLRGGAEIVVLVDFPLNRRVFDDAVEYLSQLGVDTTFCFRVKDEGEVEAVESLEFGGANGTLLLPYFDGTNLDFFERNVFLSEEIILGVKPTFRDIFSRQAINGNNFGKLTVFPNGRVYSNVNVPSLGNINRHSLYEIVYKELLQGRSWRLSRCHIKPCNRCIFEALCPPISNYEMVLGRNNLCDIIPSRDRWSREK